jgi:hypothetical protein
MPMPRNSAVICEANYALFFPPYRTILAFV